METKDVILRLRTQKGLSQEELAAKLIEIANTRIAGDEEE